MISKEVQGKIIDRLFSQAKTNVKETEVSKVTERIIDTMNSFDGLCQYDSFVQFDDGKRSLDEVPVLNELKDFVIPASVKFVAGDRNYEDLLVREDGGKAGSYDDYLNNISVLRGWFKKEPTSDTVDLRSLKTNVSVSDVLTIISVSGRVRDVGDAFVPIPIRDLGIWKSQYFNSDVNSVLDDFVNKLFF